MANISSFTNALQGGGARANQFEVSINGGGGTGYSQSRRLLNFYVDLLRFLH